VLDTESPPVANKEFAREHVRAPKEATRRQAPLPPRPEPTQAVAEVEMIARLQREVNRLDSGEPYKHIAVEEPMLAEPAATGNRKVGRGTGGEPPMEPLRPAAEKQTRLRTETEWSQVEARPWREPMREEEPLHAPYEMKLSRTRNSDVLDARPVDRRGGESLLEHARPRQKPEAPRIEIGTVEVRISEPPKTARKAKPAPPATLSRGLRIPFGVGQG